MVGTLMFVFSDRYQENHRQRKTFLQQKKDGSQL